MSRNKSVKASQTATLTPRESLLKKSKPTIISSKIPFQTLSSGLDLRSAFYKDQLKE